jgi:hypothetical protein
MYPYLQSKRSEIVGAEEDPVSPAGSVEAVRSGRQTDHALGRIRCRRWSRRRLRTREENRNHTGAAGRRDEQPWWRHQHQRLRPRMTTCTHLATIRAVAPSAPGCVECLATGGHWVHLRMCQTCGHVDCCDSPPSRHASGHFRATGHELIRSFEPGEDWYWCYVDDIVVNHGGAIGHRQASLSARYLRGRSGV